MCWESFVQCFYHPQSLEALVDFCFLGALVPRRSRKSFYYLGTPAVCPTFCSGLFLSIYHLEAISYCRDPSIFPGAPGLCKNFAVTLLRSPWLSLSSSPPAQLMSTNSLLELGSWSQMLSVDLVIGSLIPSFYSRASFHPPAFPGLSPLTAKTSGWRARRVLD